MDDWDKENPLKENHLSESTRRGLRVTIKSTIDLLNDLTTNYDYKYLMTDRLNQDALEVIIFGKTHLNIIFRFLIFNLFDPCSISLEL